MRKIARAMRNNPHAEGTRSVRLEARTGAMQLKFALAPQRDGRQGPSGLPIDQHQRLAAIGQGKADGDAVAVALDAHDLRVGRQGQAMRQVPGRNRPARHRCCGRRRHAMIDPIGDAHDERDNADDQQDPHRHDQYLQPAHASRPSGFALLDRLSMAETRTVIVDGAATGERLDRFLARALAPLSRTQTKRLIEGGQVVVAGVAATDPAAKTRAGQSFSITLPEPVPDKPVPQAMALVIPYEDEHLLVVDKPAGLVVHPAPGNPDRTLVNALIAHCGDALAGIGGVKRPGIVHRLDKDTSGLMVVAKTELAHHALSADFAARRIERAYRAIVWGVPPAEGEIAGAIGRNPHDRKRMALVARGGKAALTRYR